MARNKRDEVHFDDNFANPHGGYGEGYAAVDVLKNDVVLCFNWHGPLQDSRPSYYCDGGARVYEVVGRCDRLFSDEW